MAGFRAIVFGITGFGGTTATFTTTGFGELAFGLTGFAATATFATMGFAAATVALATTGFGATAAAFFTTGFGDMDIGATGFGAAALATSTFDACTFAFAGFIGTVWAAVDCTVGFRLVAAAVPLLEVRSIGCGKTFWVAAGESALAPVASAAAVMTKSEKQTWRIGRTSRIPQEL